MISAKMIVGRNISQHSKGADRKANMDGSLSSKESKNKVKTPKQKKKKRLIIRNLSFKVDEEELKQVFSKFGSLIDVKIPLKPDGKKRGFAFVEYKDTKALIQAMKSMNYQEIQGRKVAIDYAMDKTNYQLKLQDLKKEGIDLPSVKKEITYDSDVKSEKDSDEETDDEEKSDDGSEGEDEDEKRLNTFLKEFDSGAEALTKAQKLGNSEDVSSSESSGEEFEDDEEDLDMDSKAKIKPEVKDTSNSPSKNNTIRKDSGDVNEKKTVFLRNVSFTTTEDSLKEAMLEYGECVYCLLCMDQLTNHPKGTAFVKFKEKSSTDKLLHESFVEPGVVVDGRKLNCSYAISREDVSNLGEDSKKPKDKRNLNLLRVGLIMPNSKESEGVSRFDMNKRAQLEMTKKFKLRNVNFCVSDQRLMIHNLPKDFTDIKLRQLFKNAVGRGAVITEARVMKEFIKMDSQGTPLSKGFGFVSFSNHEDALKALTELNNNPKIFTSQKRPIVEFSVENKVALLSKERRKEKIQMRNKRRTEEKKERQLNQNADGTEKSSAETTKKRKRKKNKKNKTDNKKLKTDLVKNSGSVVKESSPKSKEKRKNRKLNQESKKKQASIKSNQDMSSLINKYKDKLVNKMT